MPTPKGKLCAGDRIRTVSDGVIYRVVKRIDMWSRMYGVEIEREDGRLTQGSKTRVILEVEFYLYTTRTIELLDRDGFVVVLPRKRIQDLD